MRSLNENDDRTITEILCGLQGGNPPRERSYSSDPDYDSVDPEIFNYYNALSSFFEYEAEYDRSA